MTKKTKKQLRDKLKFSQHDSVSMPLNSSWKKLLLEIAQKLESL